MNTLILESLLIPEIATEADDITKKVNDILGGKNSPTETVSEDQREEDLTQTDGIFDDINKDASTDNPQDNPTNEDDDNQANEDEPSGADELSDSFNDESDPGNEDDVDDTSDDPSMDDQDGMKPEDKSIFSDKNTLKKNMIYFFNIIRYTINSLEESLGLCNNQETIRVINSVIQNLYSCKEVLYSVLTNHMEKSAYEELVTKYVTIKRIYDISCDMLEEHFNNNPKSRVKYNRFKNKS